METPARLRVLEIGKYYPPHHGGMESHLRTLCLALKDEVDFTVLVASDTRTTSTETSDGFPVTRVGTWARVASAPVSPALAYHIWGSKPDVIHIHMPHPASIPAYLLAAPNIPLVITYHSDIVRQKHLAKAVAPIIERALARASIIVTSPQYLNSSPVLARHHERCKVVPLAISPEDFATPDADEVRKLRERYGPNLVVAVGRLVYYKGFEYLIRAMGRVDGNLLLIGQGPLLQPLRKIARECGVANRVTFLDGVDDIVPYYHAAEIFVLPSIARSEAFGIVQLEAMACGKPVINTSLDTGVPFVSLDGITGFTVPPKDSDSLAHAINLLMERPELRWQFGVAARQRVSTHFDVPIMADSTMAILREAAYGARRAARPARAAAASGT